MTEATVKKMEMVKNLVSQGSTVKEATKKAKIDVGYYYRSKKKSRSSKVINISFMGMEISGDPNVVKDFVVKFMKEYRTDTE